MTDFVWVTTEELRATIADLERRFPGMREAYEEECCNGHFEQAMGWEPECATYSEARFLLGDDDD